MKYGRGSTPPQPLTPDWRHTVSTTPNASVIHYGDCIETMNDMPPESVDAIVTDPPYGLGFMGKKWDGLPPSLEWAEACYRVLKPGGHIAAFGGTRTWHRLAVAIEDAGFEMRDSLAWLYGSGFPKSHDVSKAIDKLAGAERTVPTGVKPGHERFVGRDGFKSVKDGGALSGEGGFSRPWMEDPEASERYHQTFAPATPEAEQWDGWGTALKPAFEPIVLARKPLAEKTVARNVLAHGTGAINIDRCRIAGEVPSVPQPDFKHVNGAVTHLDAHARNGQMSSAPSGRWPANVLLDHHAAAWVDEQSGVTKGRTGMTQHSSTNRIYGEFKPTEQSLVSDGQADEGGASRFFYTAKAPKRERPTYTRPMLRLRDNLTPEQADHVRARLQEAGISLD